MEVMDLVFDIINNMQQSKSLLSPFNLILSHFEPKISDKMVFLEKFDIYNKFKDVLNHLCGEENAGGRRKKKTQKLSVKKSSENNRN